MKAKEVLSRYARGERNFQWVNLRGQSFQNQNLAGADFAEADIRGTSFAGANLTGANFAEAIAGVQKRWLLIQQLIAGLLSILSGFLSAFSGAVIVAFFTDTSSNRQAYFIAGICLVVFLITTLLAITRQGFTTQAMASIAAAVAVAVAVTVAVAVAFVVAGIFASAFAVAFAVAVAVAVAVVVAVTGTFAFAVAFAVAGAVAGAIAVAVAVAGAGAVVVAVTGKSAVAVAVAVAVSSFLLGIYSARRAMRGDPKFAVLRTFGVALGAIGGTRFNQADLTGANFSRALLKGANFRDATLTHVCWNAAQKLDRAHMGDANLSDQKIQKLLVSLDGHNQAYTNANLSGVNLAGADLNGASFKHTDLSNAILRQAQLKDANLAESLCVGADFTQAYLTGACLQGWNIDYTTKLDNVDCQYVYLLKQPNTLGHRERRPHEPDQVFAQGEFQALYTKMMDGVQILLKNGINQAAFSQAFQQLMAEHPEITYDSIQAVERKGNDALVTLAVSETADKAEISRSLRQAYETKIQPLEGEVKELNQIRAADLKEVAMVRNPIFNQVGGNHPVQENIDQRQNISVGGDLNLQAQNSVVSLGDISGNVTNTIQQLPNPTDPGQLNLKELLTQLHRAIATTTELTETDKKDLLEEVQNLATAAQTPAPAEKESLARKAKKIFTATLSTLGDSAKLADTCSKLLPLIFKALGLPVP